MKIKIEASFIFIIYLLIFLLFIISSFSAYSYSLGPAVQGSLSDGMTYFFIPRCLEPLVLPV